MADSAECTAEAEALHALFDGQTLVTACQQLKTEAKLTEAREQWAAWKAAPRELLGQAVLAAVKKLDAPHLLATGIAQRLHDGVAAASFGLWALMKAIEDPSTQRVRAALAWLAARDPRLEAYEGPAEPLAEPVAVDALVVHGCSMAVLPQAAADLFVDVLHPAGCRVVLLTGGVGRETPPLWRDLCVRGLTHLFAAEPWAADAPPASVRLPTQGVSSKPVLQGFDVAMAPETTRSYCTEADVMLELFTARCRERGLEVAYGGNPCDDSSSSAAAPHAADGPPHVYLETASTHTGTNVEYSRRTLQLVGLGEAPTICAVQQPTLHRRACLTWQKQLGQSRPVTGWTLRPTEAVTGRPLAELARYALGELERIPTYAAANKGFCVMPPDWPEEARSAVQEWLEAHGKEGA